MCVCLCGGGGSGKNKSERGKEKMGSGVRLKRIVDLNLHLITFTQQIFIEWLLYARHCARYRSLNGDVCKIDLVPLSHSY